MAHLLRRADGVRSALILIANGTEEMEFVITYDTLVRGGISCKSALVNDIPDSIPTPSPVAKCSRGVKIIADHDLADIEDPTLFDALIIPGGAKGAETLSQNKKVQNLIRTYLENDKVVGMICAGSLAALRSSLPRSKITSHPSVKTELESAFEYSEDPVVVSGKLVTRYGTILVYDEKGPDGGVRLGFVSKLFNEDGDYFVTNECTTAIEYPKLTMWHALLNPGSPGGFSNIGLVADQGFEPHQPGFAGMAGTAATPYGSRPVQSAHHSGPGGATVSIESNVWYAGIRTFWACVWIRAD
ncbi:hypothetical protein FRB90_011552 [Tulasnella sp. 427]|nr:hypothetical protein FRB90_011552 [Tulasnella sp. 427]